MSSQEITIQMEQASIVDADAMLVLASTSAIKRKAMGSVFHDFQCVDVGRCTAFEQPFDYHGASMCAAQRIAAAVRLGREAGAHRVDTQYVAIENYVTAAEQGTRWFLQDRALVVHWSELMGGVSFLSRDNAVLIPDDFVNRDTDYTARERSQGGTCRPTFGRTIAEHVPGIAHDDWFHHFSQPGSPFLQISRHEQLVGVLHELCHHLRYTQRLLRSVSVYAGYAGVPRFLDLWSVFASPAQTLNMVELMRAHCMDAMRATDASGNELQPPPIIVGLEMRGAVLGAMLASRLTLPFVPIRKLGAKLPGQCIQSGGGGSGAKTEYGSSTAVQMQVEYVGGGGGAATPRQRCIVVDDVIATGNSLAVACEMLESSGRFEVVAIVAVMDIPALRDTWRQRLGCNVVGSGGEPPKHTVHLCVDANAAAVNDD